MQQPDDSQQWCVLGAGSSGLVAAKTMREQGFAVEVLEREDDIGGNWYYGKPHSSVYASTHLISSKRLTEYTDFPMPQGWPPFPHHRLVLQYLRDYTEHFGLRECIRFSTGVRWIERAESGWQVTLEDGTQRRYGGVIIANGHNWDPRWPEIPGEFSGLVLHSCEYKTPDVLRGKRVLVVGAGNSGCDIAVEAAQNAARTLHSVRRGYHYIPKFLFGKPSDRVGETLLRLRLPAWLRRRISMLTIRAVLGSPTRFGLPRPDHKLFQTHPIINSQLTYYLGHGDIVPKPDVEELEGDQVRFADGSREAVDVIVYATGFRITIPFIDAAELNWQDGKPHLYLNVFHPEHDDLFVIGLIQPDSGQFGLVDYQSQLVARYLRAKQAAPAKAEWFRRQKQEVNASLDGKLGYLNSPRHLLEVEHFSYRNRLRKLISKLA